MSTDHRPAPSARQKTALALLLLSGLGVALSACAADPSSSGHQGLIYGHEVLAYPVEEEADDPEAQAELTGTLRLSEADCVVVENADGSLTAPMFPGAVMFLEEDEDSVTFSVEGTVFSIGQRVSLGGGTFPGDADSAQQCGARDVFRVHTLG